jgi:hypothetical protein
MEEMFFRANHGSDTPALVSNLAQMGIYVLHGDADDNVPVGQARLMRKLLEATHKDFHYREAPKMGHWWGGLAEGGCVDWKPMFELFARRRLPQPREVAAVQFVTGNPGVSARNHWAVIEAQTSPLKLSGVALTHDLASRKVSGKSDNIARLTLGLDHWNPDEPLHVEIDGQTLAEIPWPADKKLHLQREADKWTRVKPFSLADKGPHRYGPFRDAYRNRMIFVVGTQGTAEETAWAWAKARYDAETFWYRGNGSIDVVPDTALGRFEHHDRNLIFFGNAATIQCWEKYLGTSPVQVRRGQVTIGAKNEEGADLACLFIRPRPGSDRACVAVIGGSGIVGMRLTDRLPIFASGIPYPDCVVFSAEMLSKGWAGVRAAGYFGIDWSVERGEFAWRR